MIKLLCIKTDPKGNITPMKAYTSMDDKPHKAPNGQMVYTLVKADNGLMDYIVPMECVVPSLW